MTARFEVYRDATGHCRWRLKDRQGTTIAAGHEHTTPAGARRQVQQVASLAPDAVVIDLTGPEPT